MITCTAHSSRQKCAMNTWSRIWPRRPGSAPLLVGAPAQCRRCAPQGGGVRPECTAPRTPTHTYQPCSRPRHHGHDANGACRQAPRSLLRCPLLALLVLKADLEPWNSCRQQDPAKTANKAITERNPLASHPASPQHLGKVVAKVVRSGSLLLTDVGTCAAVVVSPVVGKSNFGSRPTAKELSPCLDSTAVAGDEGFDGGGLVAARKLLLSDNPLARQDQGNAAVSVLKAFPKRPTLFRMENNVSFYSNRKEQPTAWSISNREGAIFRPPQTSHP